MFCSVPTERPWIISGKTSAQLKWSDKLALNLIQIRAGAKTLILIRRQGVVLLQ